ncbi:MAG: hypothetical protein DRJ03_12755 [Chloroflexi bacterium]|nr:MAG: hypothetical protein DRI81_07820 [Chloroflexota bacterium]RLC85009.1 MAG: hypothetical protein DRJ03_12755 [Chloroflexota bacterium]
MAMNVTQTMELSQAIQTIKFLEEERRKDKAAVAVLQKQAQSQEEQLSQQIAQIQDLQTTLAGVQSLISQVTGFEQTVASYKNEMVFMLEQREEALKRARAESARLRQIEMKAVIDQLGQLDKRTQVLPRYDEEIQARQVEEQRLNEAIQRLEVVVADLSKRSDDRVQAVTYLEEQRRADNRRIAELEQETTTLRKRVETQATKLPLLEENIQKYKPRIDEAVSQIKEFEKPLEEMRVAEFRREQAVKKYMDQAEQVRQEMEEWRTQTQRFVEQYTLTKRGLEKLESFQARQEKRQNEVAEMQRLAEDRVKRQWEEWQAGQDKELKKRQVAVDEQWKVQKKVNQELARRIEPLEAQIGIHQTQIESLFDIRRMDAHRDLETVQGAVERAEQAFTQAREILRGEV